MYDEENENNYPISIPSNTNSQIPDCPSAIVPSHLSGLVMIETDDLPGGGISDEFHGALSKLRKAFNFGVWKELMDNPREYGGRTIEQHSDSGFTISMSRYLKDRAREIRLEKGRCKDPERSYRGRNHRYEKVTWEIGLKGRYAASSRRCQPTCRDYVKA